MNRVITNNKSFLAFLIQFNTILNYKKCLNAIDKLSVLSCKTSNSQIKNLLGIININNFN